MNRRESTHDAVFNDRKFADRYARKHVKMINEMERVLSPGGTIFIGDIRRSWIGYLEQEFKSGLAVTEATELIGKSNLRAGTMSSSLLWWRYESR